MFSHQTENKERKYIAPYKWQGRFGWLVKIWYYTDGRYENKKWHSKLFDFSKYSSENAALEAARLYRDQWIKEHHDQRYLRTEGVPFSKRLPRNNTSGIVGVNRSERIGRSGKIESGWQTTFTTTDGKTKNRRFSIDKYGEIPALKMAIETRRDAIITVLESRGFDEDEESYSIIEFYNDILSNLSDYKDQSPDPTVIEIVRNQEINATTKLEQIQARIGQQRFRRQVLEYFNFRCAVTGSKMLVRASHIKPWRACNNEERLDPSNGLALSPVYDAAFDLGLISFRPDGQIMLSQGFKESAEELWIAGDEQIKNLCPERLAYLDWHRKNIFQTNTG